METLDNILHEYYFNKKFYVNSKSLYKIVKPICINNKIPCTIEKIQDWLDLNSYDQIIRNVEPIKKANYLPYFSITHDTYMIDLTFLPKYKKYNEQYYILFTAINVNTRMAYVYASKNKSASTIIDLCKLWKNDCQTINIIICDQGSEFINTQFKQWAYNNNVVEIHDYNTEKNKNALCILNRFHLNLKHKLLKHFMITKSYRWLDAIGDIVYAINNTYNSGINGIPSSISESRQIYNAAAKRTPLLNLPQPFKIGDNVRIRINKRHFDKKSDIQNYTSAIYTIVKINTTTVRVAKDGEEIDKLFKLSDLIAAKGVSSDFDDITGNMQHSDTQQNRTNRELRNLE